MGLEMDKQALVVQLVERLRETLRVAEQARDAAEEEAREGATPAEKREDARTALEFQSLAKGQAQRALRARAELATLEGFRPRRLAENEPVALGAVVEVEHQSGGITIFLAPVGAGEELAGPGGDGFLSVVTPASPIGCAVLGRRVGESFETRIGGELREWTITHVE
ncbi:MAG TPA: GreA/GreB family elongation factor [Myxococcota bacterium]|nr:GreA/GreB family elongation factor [Myxococcota bacterium]